MIKSKIILYPILLILLCCAASLLHPGENKSINEEWVTNPPQIPADSDSPQIFVDPVDILADLSVSFNAMETCLDAQQNLHVIWNNSSTDAALQYKMRNSTTGAWGAMEKIGIDPTRSTTKLDIDADPHGNIHVVWCEYFEIYYAVRNISSQEWSNSTYLSGSVTEPAKNPSLAVDSDGNVHIVWQEMTDWGSITVNEIYWTFFNVSSQIWASNVLVSDDIGAWESIEPDCAAYKNESLHIVWSDEFNFFTASSDVKTLHYRIDLTTKDLSGVAYPVGNRECHRPSILLDDTEGFHIIWQENMEAFYYSCNLGTAETIHSSGIQDPLSASLVEDPEGNIFVFLRDISGIWQGTDDDIVFLMRNKSTDTWSYPYGISVQLDQSSFNPRAEIDDQGTIHVMWIEDWNSLFYCVGITNTLPTLSHPEDAHMVAGSEENVEWIITDVNAHDLLLGYFNHTYNISIDGDLVRLNQSWVDGELITFQIPDLPPGNVTLELSVSDGSEIIVKDIVEISVINTQPIISSPPNLLSVQNSPSNITWTVTDPNVGPSSYIIRVNNEVNMTGSWEDGEPVVLDTTTWGLGVYDILIEVEDGWMGATLDCVAIAILPADDGDTVDSDTGGDGHPETYTVRDFLGENWGYLAGSATLIGAGAFILGNMRKK